jgi:N-acetylneuraminic acid mutarotase
MKKNGSRFRQMKFIALFAAATVLLFLSGVVGFVFSTAAESSPGLSFSERVRYEREVQKIYFNRRTQSPESRQTFETVLPVAASETKIADVLRKSNALEQLRVVKITPEMLQAEIERMARETRQPEVLRELFAAVNNDARLVAEIIARPNLVERLSQAHGDFTESEITNFPSEIAVHNFSYHLPEIKTGDGSLPDDTWRSLPVLPEGHFEHTIVWTGAEMLVWGGTRGNFTEKVNSGSRYNPATDSWTPISGAGAPQRRRGHTAVWTGTEMIVWGGCGPATQFCGLGDGGRYNPATDSWQPVQFEGAPTPRLYHTAVWTGDRMIVWGGCRPNANFKVCNNQLIGGMYFPATDSWVLMSTVNSPSARRNHAAVWTGTEMIVWGDFASGGGRFNPNTNTWTLMNTANEPQPRQRPAYVWTGTEMIVWGGLTVDQQTTNTGGRYNPATDTWVQTNQANAPSARYLHTGVWTGTELIVWGGNVAVLGEGWLRDGARYNPATNTWTPTSVANAPTARDRHEAIWTGTEMIVWGGRRDITGKTGGRYNPATDAWTPVSTNDPLVNSDSEGVWTGSELLIFGGAFVNRGARFNPATNLWSPMATPPPAIGQRDHSFTLVWTGTEMIVWGGQTGSVVLGSGGRYNPATNSWILTSTFGAPSERASHSAVWTGTEMIVWGGTDGELKNNGARYNPQTDAWTPVAAAPVSARFYHTAVVASGKMIVWGGRDTNGTLNTGGRYDIASNTWQTTSLTNAPSPRHQHTAISTGAEMIVWGGRQFQFGDDRFNDGGRYNPITDVWAPTSLVNAPAPRSLHTAVWTVQEMIVWGGDTTSALSQLGSNTGGRYNPQTDSWRLTNVARAGAERTDHIAVWTGESMIVWGGMVRNGDPRAGYEYFVASNSRTPFDFDGDGKADVSVFRPSNGVWYLNRSQAGFYAAQWGASGDALVPGDYDGDRKFDLAVFRKSANSTWYILQSATNTVRAVQWGASNILQAILFDRPVPADYDGDGKTDLAVWRLTDHLSEPARFLILQSSNNVGVGGQWGGFGDTPVPADYDGDGRADIAVFRNGIWYLNRSMLGFTGIGFGAATDVPVAADYDGDGKADVAVFRPASGTWYLQRSGLGFTGIQFGLETDAPVPADYDGDGKVDVAVFRNGTWYLQRSTAGFTGIGFGASGDVPVPSIQTP